MEAVLVVQVEQIQPGAVQSMGSSENCNSNNTQIHQHEHPEVQMKS